jgi:hypothetical protein
MNGRKYALFAKQGQKNSPSRRAPPLGQTAVKSKPYGSHTKITDRKGPVSRRLRLPPRENRVVEA